MFEIGTSLREARLRQGLDFPEIEQATKVRGRYLRALEDEEFDALPAPTYVKGFLRNYADYLGLDGQLYVDEFNSRYIVGEPEPPLRRSAVTPSYNRRVESRIVVIAVGTIAVLAALVIAAWKFGGADTPTAPPGAPAANPHSAKQGRTPRTHHRATVAATLVLTAHGASFVKVRLQSSVGRQVFSGTFDKGQAHRFYAKRMWIAADHPENLRATLNGQPVALPVALKRTGVLVTPTGLKGAGS